MLLVALSHAVTLGRGASQRSGAGTVHAGWIMEKCTARVVSGGACRWAAQDAWDVFVIDNGAALLIWDGGAAQDAVFHAAGRWALSWQAGQRTSRRGADMRLK